MNEKKFEKLEEKINNNNKDEIIKEFDKFQSDSNLVSVKSLQSNIVFDDKKSLNRPNISNKENMKESSSSNLSNLSFLFKSFIHKNISNGHLADVKRKRTILPNSNIFKNFLLKEKVDVLNNDINNDNINLFNVIKDKIIDAKDDILKYLENSKNKLEIKYNNYINNINELLIEKEKRLSKLMKGNSSSDNLINYANDNLFKKIDDILEIHDYIFSALEDLINILYSFLDQSNLINQKKPIEYFINNNSSDILNCWLLNKFDFNQINLSKIISNKELYDLFSGYFSKMNNNEYSSISLQKNNKINFPLEIELLNKNINKVNKIKFIGLENDDIIKINGELKKDIKNIKNKENKNEAKKVRSLSIINCNFIQKDMVQISFPVLKEFKLKNTFLETSFIFKYIINESNSLIKIHIEKINLTDNDLKLFFKLLSERKEIQNSLKSLSFKGNILTKISSDNFNIDNYVFKKLQNLNFSKNNIYEFSEKIFNSLPELKVLDLTDNNISNRIFFDIIKDGEKKFQFIALLSNNIFIHNNNSNNIRYIKYIIDNLSNFQNKIKKLSFRLLFNKKSINYIAKLKISPAVKISLCKLDLSFCGLDDEILLYFFKNNYGLLNLEILNLSNNDITSKIFNLLNEIKSEILLEKLKMIDLSFNAINLEEMNDLKSLDKFLENHHELKKVKLQYTNFLDGFQDLIKDENNRDEINNIINKLTSKNIFIILETGLNNIMTQILLNVLSFKDKTY